ncbi:glycoside hydrolase family 36 protein [Kitasatospora sp. NPDC096147]|uniref:glycoside hydrolase family 36 protein n=1 Tax=Kitasatospora sp. NPDC096147 TaxID=3364093 RepID=UPI0037F5A9E0
MTTAGLTPAATEPLVDGVRIAVLGDSTGWILEPAPDGALTLVVTGDGPLEIRLSVPLGEAVGFWHPECHRERTLVADWAGLAGTSLVAGALAGCLYQADGQPSLAFAATEHVAEASMRYGVSEEHRTFVVHLHVTAVAGGYRLLLAPRTPGVGTVAGALRTLRGALRAGLSPLPTPPAALVPAYSTWYAFNQEVEAWAVEEEARRAATLGCGLLILDDGWQELGSGRGYPGVGDWVPDTAKFPDLAGHVALVRALGLRYLAWAAPLLIGPESRAYREWERHAPLPARAPGARVLDPRVPEVRRHVVATCRRLVADYGLDGLKLDFLDDVRAYTGTPAPAAADTPGVGLAMRELLAELTGELTAVRPDVLIEFRQPYAGPGLAPYANLLRADDCPADAVDNRLRTIDLSLLSYAGAIHSDMLMWDRAASPQAAARQLIATLQAVPQLSARLSELPGPHLEMLRFWLDRWHRLHPVLSSGGLEPGRPDELYQLLTAVHGDEAVLVAHADRVVPLPPPGARRLTLVNGTTLSRLVVEVPAPGLTAEATRYDALGRTDGPHRLTLPAGPVALPVPPSGLVELAVVSP